MNSFEHIVQYDFPTQIFFGTGARALLAENLHRAGCRRPLLITDRTLVELPFISEIQAGLKRANLEVNVFSGIWGNPVESQVSQGVAAYKSYTCDSAIAIGGGAVLDAAKAILLMVDHPGQLFNYEDRRKAALPIDQPIPCFLAVPTTAGTGSEVGRSTVISDDTTKAKKIIFSPRLLPKAVFADPELTLRLPPGVTAATGMDALTHCLEAYLARGFHPICEGIALEGMRLIAKSLKKCVDFAANGSAAERRSEHLYHRGLMLNAAMMGSIAFQKGLGVNHSCAHSLSTVHDLHHGLANGVMLPYTMRFNAEQEREKFMMMAQAVGLKEGSGPDDFIDWLIQLKSSIGIPEKLSTLGVRIDSLNSLVRFAVQDVCHLLNPRKVFPKNFRSLFTSAI